MSGGPENQGNTEKNNKTPDYLRAEDKLENVTKRNPPVNRPMMESIVQEGFSKE